LSTRFGVPVAVDIEVGAVVGAAAGAAVGTAEGAAVGAKVPELLLATVELEGTGCTSAVNMPIMTLFLLG